MPSTAVYLAALPVSIALMPAALMLAGRIEVRLTGAQPDHVAARRFQRARLVGHRDGGGRLDAGERVGKKGHCGGSPVGW